MLTKNQKEVLIGTLLGDGCLLPTSGGKKFRLQIAHSEKQKDYLFWKHNIFCNLVKTPPKYYFKTHSWRFRTVSDKELTDFAGKFYCSRKKILPMEFDKWIVSPLSLAIWYMDDGNIRREYGKVYDCMLNTQNFTHGENLKIQQVFLGKQNLRVLLQKNKGKERIYFPANSWARFFKIIQPYILPSMKYKLSITP